VKSNPVGSISPTGRCANITLAGEVSAAHALVIAAVASCAN
jgi:hypothetical protein